MDDHEVKVVGEQQKPEDKNVEAFGLPERLEEFHRQPEMMALLSRRGEFHSDATPC